MDWGLAKLLPSGGPMPAASEPELTDQPATEISSQRDGDLVTQAGSILGTPAFMAPEQAQGAVHEIDERSDVFGLGAVLCTILTGQPPYTGPNSDSVRLKAIRGETSVALARLDACEADPELVALCRRCLAIERDARPRHAGEVAQSVAALLAAAEERARHAELDRVRAEEQRKRRRVQRVLAGAALLVLALAVVGGGLVFYLHEARVSNERLAEEQKDADRLRGIADAGRVEETRLRGIADSARAEAEREREKFERFEYGRTMQVAHQEWRDNNVGATVALLEGTRPDLRGWEWRYVYKLCHLDLLTLKGHTGVVQSASFSADGTRIVTGSADQTAKVWNARTGREVLTLKGHTGFVKSASFSADGTRVVTASYDQTAKVWDARTGAEVLTLKGHTGVVMSASFSPDGTRVVTASYDQTARVWDATPVSREFRWPAAAAVAGTIVEWESPPIRREPPRETAPPPRTAK